MKTYKLAVPHQIFRNDEGRKVVLIGVAHVWPASAWKEVKNLMASYRAQDFEILQEGVQAPLKKFSLSSKMGELLRQVLQRFYTFTVKLAPTLVFQRDLPWFLEEKDVKADLHSDEFVKTMGLPKTVLLILLLSTSTLVLRSLNPVKAKKAFTENLLTMVSKPQKKPPLVLRFFAGTLLEARNERALAHLALTDKNVVLPWGSAHLPGLEEILLSSGYVCILDELIKVEAHSF